MKNKLLYAEQWHKSAEHFFNNNIYSWIIDQIDRYNIVLEIGCGTGYSTLGLVNGGKKVFAIEENQACVMKAIQLLQKHSVKFLMYTGKESFAECDVLIMNKSIFSENLREELVLFNQKEDKIDLCVCWNPGAAGFKHNNKELLAAYAKMRFSEFQAKSGNPSYYSELLNLFTLEFAKDLKADVQFVERTKSDFSYERDLSSYYDMIKDEYGRTKITNNIIITNSLSSLGKSLEYEGQVEDNEKIDVGVLSVIIE